MKKIFILAILALYICAGGAAWSQDALTGMFSNRAGTITVAKKAGDAGIYDIVIADKSGKCKIAVTGKTAFNSGSGKASSIITSAETDTFPNFSLWPEGHSMKLGEDSLPFDKLAPACAAFKNNVVFNRQK